MSPSPGMFHGSDEARAAYNQRKRREFAKVVDAAASTAFAERAVFVAPHDCQVDAISFLPNAALTADASNNATLTVRTRTAAGGSATSVATLVTDVAGGDWVAHVPKVFTLAANVRLTRGMQLTLEISKGGTGVVVPVGSLLVSYLSE